MIKLLFLTNIILKILAIVVPLMLLVAIYTYTERKVIGFMQSRIGPNRVGFHGMLQPIADITKLFFKEIIIPQHANKMLFLFAPIFLVVMSFVAWAAIPFGKGLVLADLNLGILYVLLITSINVYGIIIAGWASNSKYALLGGLRASAQIIAYELAMGFCLLAVIMRAGSMNLTEIVLAQSGGIKAWNCWPLFPFVLLYFIAAIAETNRAPFDVAEAETELVAGFHVEYSGITFAMFFLAEYANMILVSFLTVIMFFGGWHSPLVKSAFIMQYLTWLPPVFWLLLKASIWMFAFLWIRATFPRYRYDQIMRLGWKFFIPLSICMLFCQAILMKTKVLGI